MIHSTVKDPKIAELVQELRELKTKYHGFTMAIAREADTNYNNLCSMLSQDEEWRAKRKMGYHIYFLIVAILPKVKKEFAKKKEKKV